LLTSSTLSGTILKLNSFDEKRIYCEGLSIKDIIGSNRSIIKYTTKEINRKISCSFLLEDLNKIKNLITIIIISNNVVNNNSNNNNKYLRVIFKMKIHDVLIIIILV
jgi:hypothetical protein